MRGIAQINFFKRANAPFMRTPALGKLSLKRHAGGAASKKENFPTRLYTPALGKLSLKRHAGGAASKEEIFPAQLHKSIGQR